MRTGIWYRAGAFRVRSLMPGVSIAPTSDLPVVPRLANDNSDCPSTAQPKTPEGKWVLSRCWRITDEDRFGPLTMVNAMRSFALGFNSDCHPIAGRFLLFNGGKIIATIVTTSPDDADFGRWEKTTGGGLRLTTVPDEPPFGDLFVRGRDVDIEPLPQSEKACDGTKTMPNVFGKPIETARRILRRAGWRAVPVQYSFEDLDDGDFELRHYYGKGITEVTTCEPHSWCEFGYRSGRATALMFSQGGAVTSRDVDCDGHRVTVGIQR